MSCSSRLPGSRLLDYIPVARHLSRMLMIKTPVYRMICRFTFVDDLSISVVVIGSIEKLVKCFIITLGNRRFHGYRKNGFRLRDSCFTCLSVMSRPSDSGFSSAVRTYSRFFSFLLIYFNPARSF